MVASLPWGKPCFPHVAPFFLPCHRDTNFGSRRVKPGSAGNRLRFVRSSLEF
jgi:hypothetical protein